MANGLLTGRLIFPYWAVINLVSQVLRRCPGRDSYTQIITYSVLLSCNGYYLLFCHGQLFEAFDGERLIKMM